LKEGEFLIPKYETFAIIDTDETKDKRRLSIFQGKSLEYAHHQACGVLWKKAIYIVGGELEGRWSTSA